MKLRNKKTGEIVEPCGINLINGRAFMRFDDEKGTFKFEAHSLAERIDNLTDEQRKQILIKTRKEMEKVLQEAKNE